MLAAPTPGRIQRSDRPIHRKHWHIGRPYVLAERSGPAVEVLAHSSIDGFTRVPPSYCSRHAVDNLSSQSWTSLSSNAMRYEITSR
jgi:hypothetical protein